MARDERSDFVLLVGPPAVGKSTFVAEHYPDAFVVSRDDIVQEVADEYGLTYNDLFEIPANDVPKGYRHPRFGVAHEGRPGSWKNEKGLVWSKVASASGKVNRRFFERCKEAKLQAGDVVVDMTNMHRKARKDARRWAPKGHRKVAVLFEWDEELVKERARHREKELRKQGIFKSISDDVFERMFDSFEEPTKVEGYEEIIVVNTFI